MAKPQAKQTAGSLIERVAQHELALLAQVEVAEQDAQRRVDQAREQAERLRRETEAALDETAAAMRREAEARRRRSEKEREEALAAQAARLREAAAERMSEALGAVMALVLPELGEGAQ